MNLQLATGRPVLIGRPELGSGAEGRVFPAADSESLCIKLYLQPSAETADRVRALIVQDPVSWRGDHPLHLHVAWPRAVVLDEHGETRGFVMHRANGFPWLGLLDAGRRATLLAEPSWQTSLSIAARLARLLGMLHHSGIVVADISPRNVVVDRCGHVTLIDCDATTFTDSKTGHWYKARKITPEYAAPEVLRNGPAATSRHSDTFALTIMIIELLMEGTHPFEGVPTGATAAVGASDNIRLRNNRITHPERLVHAASDLPVELLPPSILPLVAECFGPGHDDPTRRPTARQWENALNLAAHELTGCHRNERHHYPVAMGSCPWCVRNDAGFGEHFPNPTITTTNAFERPGIAVSTTAVGPTILEKVLDAPAPSTPTPLIRWPGQPESNLRSATGRRWYTPTRLGVIFALCLATGALCWVLIS